MAKTRSPYTSEYDRLLIVRDRLSCRARIHKRISYAVYGRRYETAHHVRGFCDQFFGRDDAVALD
jgi:hypothetical protein